MLLKTTSRSLAYLLQSSSSSGLLSLGPIRTSYASYYHSSHGPQLGASAALASKPDPTSSGGKHRGRGGSAQSQRPHKNKPTRDLLNSYLVFKLCGVTPLVSATPTLIETARKLNLTKPLYCGIKNTFFKHFCGGENLEEVAPTIEQFKQAGIGSILDLAMEADLDSGTLHGTVAQEHAAKISGMMKESIDIAATQPGNFIAVKITAFVPPGILLRWSNTLQLLRKGFLKEVSGDEAGKMDINGFSRLAQDFPGLQGHVDSAFKAMDIDKDGRIDWIDLKSYFSLFNSTATNSLILVNPPKEPSARHDFELVTSQDLSTANLVLKELEGLCSYAREKKVRIMMDAEQTYFQPAIDDVSLGLCQRFNEPLSGSASGSGLKYALIYNTYQLYLKDGYSRLVMDVERAKRLGYAFGVKIVRGAYMVSERDRAQFLRIPDPINPDIESTHSSFNKAIEFLIQSIGSSSKDSPVQPLRFVVASHNQNSIRHACNLMAQHQIDASDGTVAFAQLMGMQDGTTFGLASQGIKAYKYIPYGPIEVAIPYLHRRAQENSSVLGGVGEDKRQIWEELSRRLTGKS